MQYPTFTQSGARICAFLRPDRMFMLTTDQFGKGHGFEFRIYQTRATCRKHEHEYNQISYTEFVRECKNVLGEYLIELTNYLPKELTKLDGGERSGLQLEETTTP